MKADVLGKAMLDYYRGKPDGHILTFSSLDEEDCIPVSYLFREFDEMPFLEQTAIDLCRGSVLDIGCGAGCHSLYLQQKGVEVTSLDSSPGAVEVSRLRGLKDVVEADLWTYGGRKFDTLLLLMNGIGLAGRVEKLPEFLRKARELLNPGGQVLFDSSDIIYMFDPDETDTSIPSYYGEVVFQVQYGKQKSEPFPWLYIDFACMRKIAEENGFSCELVRKGDHYDYLAKLSLSG